MLQKIHQPYERERERGLSTCLSVLCKVYAQYQWVSIEMKEGGQKIQFTLSCIMKAISFPFLKWDRLKHINNQDNIWCGSKWI